jgi:hypothetical protein
MDHIFSQNRLRAELADVISRLPDLMSPNAINEWLQAVDKYGGSPSVHGIAQEW